jgi:hypothetical protein
VILGSPARDDREIPRGSTWQQEKIEEGVVKANVPLPDRPVCEPTPPNSSAQQPPTSTRTSREPQGNLDPLVARHSAGTSPLKQAW